MLAFGCIILVYIIDRGLFEIFFEVTKMFAIKVLCLSTIIGAFFGATLYRVRNEVNARVSKELALAHLLWVISTAAAWMLIRVMPNNVPPALSIAGFMITIVMAALDVFIIKRVGNSK